MGQQLKSLSLKRTETWSTPKFSLSLCRVPPARKQWQIRYRAPSFTVLFDADRLGLSRGRRGEEGRWVNGWLLKPKTEKDGGVKRKIKRKWDCIIAQEEGGVVKPSKTTIYIKIQNIENIRIEFFLGYLRNKRKRNSNNYGPVDVHLYIQRDNPNIEKPFNFFRHLGSTY